MKVLVIGSGGREHAMVWKLSQSSQVTQIFVSPGNAGTQAVPKATNITQVDTNSLISFAQNNMVDVTVVGPEAPLARGVVDAFRAAGLLIFGPTQGAAQLESSKAFAKDFMVKHHIPTAEFQVFTSSEKAKEYIGKVGAPIVIKEDGLAAGKGVYVCMSVDEAYDALHQLYGRNLELNDGKKIVVEEFLDGEEVSFIVMADGKSVLPMATSQDHKRLLDGDLGPNTGGMGAYSPAPIVTDKMHQNIMNDVILPTLKGMEADGLPFTGFLYAGLMVSKSGQVKVLEFNCRMGDPETQPILRRLDSDLFEAFYLGAQGKLDQVQLSWLPQVAIGVVVAAPNYPKTPKIGEPIIVPKDDAQCVVFHAGTEQRGVEILSSGGRVLCVTAIAPSMKLAQKRAYDLLGQVQLKDMQFRNDIGARAQGII